jgi:hypothetical protein
MVVDNLTGLLNSANANVNAATHARTQQIVTARVQAIDNALSALGAKFIK